MNKQISKIAMLSFIVLAIAFSAPAQTIYVKVRPAVPVVVRPAAPSAAHVWIAEEWEPRGGAYVFAGGHWVVPPHPGWIWIPGHWKHRRYGDVWIRGHWRRR